MRKLLMSLPLLLLSSTALAESGLITEHIPRGAEQPVVIAIVKQAMLSHGWESISTTPDSVSARNDTPQLRTQLTIRIVDGKLVYDGGTKRANGLKAPIPPRWLNNLRQQIGASLATIPDR